MRKLLMAACAALFAGVAAAQEMPERVLFDKATGVAVMVPQDWDFFVERTSLRAVSEDGHGFVYMMATKEKFEKEIVRLEETAGDRFFKDVEISEAVILMGTERGELDEAIALRGTALHRDDGEPVEFAALLVKSGDVGELIFGAWKDREHAEIVRRIVDSVHIRMPQMESGLMLWDKTTGATITIPDQWSVYGTKNGLLAFSPDRQGMTLLVKSDDDFTQTRRRVREVLMQRVFEDVRVGKLEGFAGVDAKAYGEVLAAKGTARDRVTGEPAEFMVLVAERVGLDEDRGVLVVGAWKDEAYKQLVRDTLQSLDVKK